MRLHRLGQLTLFSLIVFSLLSLAACSSSKVMDMAFLSITVKAVDENEQPIANAIVESDGQRVTTDKEGKAKLKFGAVGVHQITVLAQDKVPATLRVTMPLDQGKTEVARLTKGVDVSANININIGGNFSAMMMGQLYPMLFQSMFSAYGYSMELANYKESQWTEWQLYSEEDGEPIVIRKAFLKQLDNKQQWWGMYIKGKEADDNMLMEVLFSADRDSIRRMRQKIGQEEAAEVPVTENWYTQPTQLTPESLEGSIKERGVSVKTPAGSFTADLIEFSAMTAGGKVRLWRVKEVPGGVVRTEATNDEKQVVWWSELADQGSGAKTELGSY